MKTNLKLSFILILSFNALFIGCSAESNLVRTEADSIIPGKTTYNEIIQRFGEPDESRIGIATITFEPVKVVAYSWDMGIFDVLTGDLAFRSDGFCFFKDILIGYKFQNENVDSIEQRIPKIEQIIKGETTFTEIIKLFGNPNEMYIYPLISGKDRKEIVYSYSKTKFMQFYSKRLAISLDRNDVAIDVVYNSSGEK